MKWFNATKGYRLIQPQGGSPAILVHISALERAGLCSLNENQAIEYELAAGGNGMSSTENLKLE